MDIFVGSIPFKMKESDLKELFEKYGKVSSATIIIDKISRQSKGFGFVEMPDDKEALTAIKALDGFEVMDRTIEVKPSEKKEKKRPVELLRSGKLITKKKKINVISRYKDEEKKGDESNKKPSRRIKKQRHQRKRK